MIRKLYKEQYFIDHREQAVIERDILEAIKPGWTYYNIVIVLLKMAKWFAESDLSEEWHGVK